MIDEELRKALNEFRSAVIETLADIQIQVAAVEAACQEKGPVTKQRFDQLKHKVNEHRERYRNRLSERIPLAYEFRE